MKLSEELVNIEERLKNLEMQNRYQRKYIKFSSFIFVFICLTGASYNLLSPISTNQLQVIGKNGKVVATVSSDNNGGALELWNNNGQQMFKISSNSVGGDLAIFNNEGKNIAGFYAKSTGSSLKLWDSNQQSVIQLHASPDKSNIQLGKSKWTPESFEIEHSENILSLKNNGLQVRRKTQPEPAFKLFAYEDGSTSLSTSGKNGNGGNIIGSLKNGNSFLELRNTKNTASFRAYPNEIGAGTIELIGNNAKTATLISYDADSGSKWEMFSHTGKRRAVLGSTIYGGTLNLHNNNGEVIFSSGSSDTNGNGALSIHNYLGVPVVKLATSDTQGSNAPNSKGAGVLNLYDKDGKNKRTFRTRY